MTSSPPRHTAGTRTLVPDINDRNPFGSPWDELDAGAVERFLSQTEEDEPLHWEAKGTRVNADAIRKAVAGLANAEGGYLILGASRTDGRWELDGVDFPDAEPRLWLGNVLRTLRMQPNMRIHAWKLPSGKSAAVVQVQPNVGALSIVPDKPVYVRREGQTVTVEDGATLTSLTMAVAARSRAIPGGMPAPGEDMPATDDSRETERPAATVLATQLDPAQFLELAKRLVIGAEARPFNVWLSHARFEAQQAALSGNDAALDTVLDRYTDVLALAITYELRDVAERTIRGLKALFDLGLSNRLRGPSVVPPDHLWLKLIGRVRAIGALAVRLEAWPLVRVLALHPVGGEHHPLWPNWVGYAEVQISRARLYDRANVLDSSRAPLSIAAEHTLRLPSLRPDNVPNEDAAVTSACEFDLFLNLAASYEYRDAQRVDHAAFQYYAAWDEERVKGIAGRLVADQGLRDAVLPGVSNRDLAELLVFQNEQAGSRSQGMGSWFFWHGFTDGRVGQFLAQYSG